MAALDLMCWTEIESFRALPANDTVLRNAKARQIKSKFLCKKYFFAAGSPASKEQQKQVGQGQWAHVCAFAWMYVCMYLYIHTYIIMYMSMECCI